MTDTFDPIAFLSAVSGDGDWSDEFLEWYRPGKWLSDEEACAAFIGEMFDRLQADRDSWYQQASDRLDNAIEFAAKAIAAQDKCAALRAFANAIMGEWPDVGGLDGFDLQLIGVKHGLLESKIRYAPCCEEEEGCRCADDADEDDWKAGITCYRKTPLLTGGEK